MTDAPFRLALRSEGEWWNAYFARRDTMQDAILLGSIRLRIVENDEQAKRQFMRLMKGALAVAIKQTAGLDIAKWNKPVAGPESERTRE